MAKKHTFTTDQVLSVTEDIISNLLDRIQKDRLKNGTLPKKTADIIISDLKDAQDYYFMIHRTKDLQFYCETINEYT